MKSLVYLIKYAYIFFATFTHTKAPRKQDGLDLLHKKLQQREVGKIFLSLFHNNKQDHHVMTELCGLKERETALQIDGWPGKVFF